MVLFELLRINADHPGEMLLLFDKLKLLIMLLRPYLGVLVNLVVA